MTTTTQESAKSASKTELLHYRELSTMRKMLFDLKVASVRLTRESMIYIASLFQRLEGRSRIFNLSYPRHPHLKHRVIPPPETSDALPPLFLDIHGGGFIMGRPWNDDEPNLCLSSSLNCLVISMDYSKAPAVQFPTPTNELTQAVLDILEDTSLRFDRSRVAIGGYSAGGNLCLSVAQSPLLRDKLRGVVSWYPVTDAMIPCSEKVTTRPYPRAGEVDMLEKDYDMFLRAYAPRDALSDPGLSPTYTSRENLPKDLLIVGAELDLLCKEAAVMAGKYAGVDVDSLWARDVAEKFGFEAPGIRWLCVQNARHGFTHSIVNFGAEGKKRTEVARQHYLEICRWLTDGPFSSKTSPMGSV